MIPLRELRRIERDLRRASDMLERHYPRALQNWVGSADDLETIRNLDTALAHVRPWINFRKNNRRDPFLKGSAA